MMPPAIDESNAEPIHIRPPSSPDERKLRARERLRRHLGSDAPPSSIPPKPASSIPPSPEQAEERRTSVIKGLRESLRSVGRHKDGTDPMLGHLKRAKEAEVAGDLLGAAAALQAALTLDPTHLEINEQYARVSKAVSRSLADNYEKQARYEEKMGKWPAAAASWARVTDGRPEDASAARFAAEALLKAGGDLHLAQRYAQRAVDLDPSSVGSVVVLARIFLAAGLRLNARRELEKAVKLDPQDEMIKNLLLETR
jgi:tetratricopeptide (TPR) repeat protein